MNDFWCGFFHPFSHQKAVEMRATRAILDKAKEAEEWANEVCERLAHPPSKSEPLD